jgi:hypothetical protein
MLKLWVGRGIGHRDAARMMPPRRWLRMLPALVGNSRPSPVGETQTESMTGGSEPEVRVRGRNTAAGPSGGAAPDEISAAPPPLFLPIELPAQPPPASAKSRERNQRSHGGPAPVTRKRVVLLPHAPIEPPDTRPHQRRTPAGPPA